MNRKKWILIFGAEAICCIVSAVLLRGGAQTEAGVFAFPFAQIGQGLRALSLSGAAGNAAAIAIYVLLSLIPAGFFVLRLRRTELDGESFLLLLLSATLFGVLYVMVNPALLDRTNLPDRAFGQAALGGLIYVQLCAYAVLRMLRSAFAADAHTLRRYARIGLLVLAAVYVYCAFGQSLTALFVRFDELYAGNTDRSGLGWTKACLILRAAVDAAAYALDVWVIFAGLALLRARDAADSELAAQAAQTLAARCRTALTITVLSSLGVYLVQVALSAKLRQTALTLSLPLGSIAFCLGALLLARLMQENRRLQADNDLFI